MKWRTVYHVTHENCVPTIRERGLDPLVARGLALRVWLCDIELLPWALSHVQTSHRWDKRQLKAIRVTLPSDVLIRHRAGVYYVNFRIPPGNLGATLACQY